MSSNTRTKAVSEIKEYLMLNHQSLRTSLVPKIDINGEIINFIQDSKNNAYDREQNLLEWTPTLMHLINKSELKVGFVDFWVTLPQYSKITAIPRKVFKLDFRKHNKFSKKLLTRIDIFKQCETDCLFIPVNWLAHVEQINQMKFSTLTVNFDTPFQEPYSLTGLLQNQGLKQINFGTSQRVIATDTHIQIGRILNAHLRLGNNIRQRDVPGFQQKMIEIGAEAWI